MSQIRVVKDELMKCLIGLAAALAMLVSFNGVGVAADENGERKAFRIDFAAPPEVQVTGDELSEEEWFSGHFGGTVPEESDPLFAGAEVTCEFEGYAAPGRAFSCGFITVEQVSGRCLFTDANGDAAVAEWDCRTNATMTSDARCEGKAEWVSGSGKFAGITGEARLHSDLFLQPGQGFALWKGHWRIATMAGGFE